MPNWNSNKKLLSILAGLFILIVFVLYNNGFVRFVYPSLQNFPVQGIDVSHHQGDINWVNVATQKELRFVYIKASEGGDFKDKQFLKNLSGSRKAGLLAGPYHFFTFCRSGKEQAANFLAALDNQKTDLPVAIDLEFVGNCKKRPNPMALAKEVNDFVREIEKQDTRKPIFYITNEFFDLYLKGYEDKYKDHDIWLRNILHQPRQSKCERWSLWQYADHARISGVQGPVDLNVACLQSEFFSKYLEI